MRNVCKFLSSHERVTFKMYGEVLDNNRGSTAVAGAERGAMVGAFLVMLFAAWQGHFIINGMLVGKPVNTRG